MSKNYASKVISIANREVGYLEKATNSQLGNKTSNAGYNNWTKYADFFDKKYPNFYNGRKNGFDWCDMFVDWCFVTAFGYEEGRKLLCQPLKSTGAGCSYSAQFYKNNGQFHTSNPKPGDQIFFGSSISNAYHTGLVYKVDSIYVYTIEGNTSSSAGVVPNGGCVAKKQYRLDYYGICGYGRPKYDKEPVAKVYTTLKSNATIYQKDWKDPLGGASKGLKTVKKGSKIEFIKDVGFGWSKVKSGSTTGYVMNSHLNKTGLSKFGKTAVLKRNATAIKLTNHKKNGTFQLKKGQSYTIISEIESGSYKEYYYLGKSGGRYYIKKKDLTKATK